MDIPLENSYFLLFPAGIEHRMVSMNSCLPAILSLIAAIELLQYGVNLKRQEYYTDSPVEGTGTEAQEKMDDAS